MNKTSRKVKDRAILLLFPLVGTAGALFMRFASGPFWLGGNSDPSYIYLISSLHILDGIPPIFIDHPGTTLQLLGAGVFRLLTLNQPAAEVSRAVLADPEFYLHAVYYVLVGMFAASLFALGWAAFQRTRDRAFALLLQSPGLLSLTLRSYMSDHAVLPVAANVNSDTLILTMTNLFLIVMLKCGLDEKRSRDGMCPVWAGLAGGLGITTKFSFLPLLVIPLIIIKGLKRKLVYVVSLLTTWLVVTIPIMPRYGKLFSWLKGLALHKGFHGSGGAGIDWSKYGAGLSWLVRENLLMAGVTLTALAFLVVTARRKQGPPGGARLLAATLAASVAQFLLVAKQTSPHYMAPGLGLCGVLAGVVYLFLVPRHAAAKRVALVLLAVFTVCRLGYAGSYYQELKTRNHATREFSEQILEKYKDCAVCGYYRSSSIPIALDFGNDCFGLHSYSDILNELYPDTFFYNYWTRQLHDFHDTVPLKTIRERKSCVLLYGSGYDFSQGFLVTEEEAVGPAERLDRLLYSTADEAVKNYLLAKLFESKQDFKRALGFARKAQELHYPDLDQYLLFLWGQVIKNQRNP